MTYECKFLMEEERISDLENAESGIKGIREFLRKVAGFDSEETRPRGCLMTNSITERAIHDGEVREWAQSFLRRLENAFFRAMTKARRAGEISTTNSPRDLARFLTCLTQGINVIAKVSSDGKVARRIVRTALSQLH